MLNKPNHKRSPRFLKSTDLDQWNAFCIPIVLIYLRPAL